VRERFERVQAIAESVHKKGDKKVENTFKTTDNQNVKVQISYL